MSRRPFLPAIWGVIAWSCCVIADGAVEHGAVRELGFVFSGKFSGSAQIGKVGATCAPEATPQRRAASSLSTLCMSKKDQRYKLAKRSANEDELLLTVAEQFRRREGQATISWYPGHIAKAEKELQEVISSIPLCAACTANGAHTMCGRF
jgi:hypothetical protein